MTNPDVPLRLVRCYAEATSLMSSLRNNASINGCRAALPSHDHAKLKYRALITVRDFKARQWSTEPPFSERHTYEAMEDLS